MPNDWESRGRVLIVTDSKHRPVPIEFIDANTLTRRCKIRFVARAIPSLGYEVFHVISSGQGIRTVSGARRRHEN